MEPGSHWVERIFWILMVGLSLTFATQLVKPIFDKYKESKTITTVDTTNYPIWKINFPAITVCSNIRVAASQYRAALKNPKLPWKNLTKEEQEMGVEMIFTNLIKFRSDPDEVGFTDASRKILREHGGYVESLMEMVKIIFFIT